MLIQRHGQFPAGGNPKFKADLRFKNNDTGLPVCVDRSVSARRYERSPRPLPELKAEPELFKKKKKLEAWSPRPRALKGQGPGRGPLGPRPEALSPRATFQGGFGIFLKSFWDHIWDMLVSVWNHFGINSRMFWDHFGISLGSFWNDYGIIMGSFGDHFGMILRSLWDHHGIIMGSFWYHFGII